jgi:hypothetical protein
MHIVFSTKNREPYLLDPVIREHTHAYMVGHVEKLTEYILNQEAHHKSETFEDEYRRLLKLYSIDYDERYVWD